MRRLCVFLVLLFLSPNVFVEADTARPGPVIKKTGYIKQENRKILFSEVAYKTFMRSDFNSVVRVLTDLEGADELFPNIVECEVLLNEGLSTNRRIKASYKILGIGRSYEYIESVSVLENGPERFKEEGHLVKSLDNELNSYRGYWQVEQYPEDPDYVLVTLYSYFEYNNPFFLQEFILKTFSDDEVANMFSCVEQAANEKE